MSKNSLVNLKFVFSHFQACQHGFPSKPSALAYDSELKLVAVATRTAAVTVYPLLLSYYVCHCGW